MECYAKKHEKNQTGGGLPPVSFQKMNTPEFSHVKLLLFWPFFGLMFMFLERFQPERHYYVVHCALDDLIPFWEWALIPYLLWFVFLIGALIYTFFFDTRAFRRMMHFVIVTYGITLLITSYFRPARNYDRSISMNPIYLLIL